MAPETRSRGTAPPSSRVYNSTPSLQQVQFPSRRKSVRPRRSRGNEDEQVEASEDGTTPLSAAAARLRRLKQQTLTQLDFVQSSFEEGFEGVEVGDSDLEDDVKENRRPPKKQVDGGSEEDEQPPVPSGRRKRKTATYANGEKRRRTLGDGQVRGFKTDVEEEDRKSRRRTFGDVPSSSRYHTQTITQFVGRDHLPFTVLDSDDDMPAKDTDFDAWLGGEEDMVPSSSPNTKQTAAAAASRQDSIVPQTPTKPIRTEIPSSSQQVTPLSGIMMERYGAPNATQASPSSAVAARRGMRTEEEAHAGPTPVSGTPVARRKLVVEDSYASEGLVSTPSKSMATQRLEVELGGEGVVEVASSSPGGTPKPALRNQDIEKGSSVKRVRISSASPLRSSPKRVMANGRDEIPDSEEDDDDFEPEEEEEQQQEAALTETYTAGDDTQFVMDHLAAQEQPAAAAAKEITTITSSPPLRQSTSSSTSLNNPPNEGSPPKPQPQAARKPIRKPLPPPPASTQPFESQRLPTALVQSFPSAAKDTDCIVPLSPSSLSPIIDGMTTSLTLPFRVITKVVRLWFWDGELVQYCAEVLGCEKAAEGQGDWVYELGQVYELNDPRDEEELKEDGVLVKRMTRCGYLGPSVASGMLWNLGRALFAEDEASQDYAFGTQHATQTADDKVGLGRAPSRTQGSTTSTSTSNNPNMTVSQEVEAQLKSDFAHSTQFQSDDVLVPSTPEDQDHNQTPLAAPFAAAAGQTSTIRPSQATTASQCSTPSPRKPSRPTDTASITTSETQAPVDPCPPPPTPFTTDTHGNDGNQASLPPQSSSSLGFQDYSAPSPVASHLLVHVGSSSQLLSRSQILPDSLMKEDDGMAIRDGVQE